MTQIIDLSCLQGYFWTHETLVIIEDPDISIRLHLCGSLRQILDRNWLSVDLQIWFHGENALDRTTMPIALK